MLTREKTTNIITSYFNYLFPHKVKLHHTLMSSVTNAYYFRQDPDSQIYDKYLNSKQSKLTSFFDGKFKFERVIVPRFQVSAEQITKKLQQEWNNKKLIINIDPSALIGTKRLYMKQHLQKNVYKGNSEPEPIFNSLNPSVQIDKQEIQFDIQHFLCSDPLAIQTIKTYQDMSEEKKQQLLNDFLFKLYQKQPDRFINRLKSQYKVPEAYCKIIQLAAYNQNPIYFGGINQYSLRNLLSRYLNLSQVKQLFILSLKYAQQQSYKYKLSKQNQAKQTLESRYHIYARQLIYLNYFQLIKKIQNGQLIKRITHITRISDDIQSEQATPASRRRNAIRKIKSRSNIIVLAHQYTAQTIQDYVIIKDFQTNSPYTIIQKISPNSQNSLSTLQKVKIPQNSKQTDAQKIQKHAILQVMLGTLWSEPYTLNRFPYLSQNFRKLSDEDRRFVSEMYYKKLTEYTGAKKVYYTKNISKFESVKFDQNYSQNIKSMFDQSKRQYEKYVQGLNKKMQEKERLLNNQKNKKSKKSKEDQYYQQSYEQIIDETGKQKLKTLNNEKIITQQFLAQSMNQQKLDLGMENLLNKKQRKRAKPRSKKVKKTQ